MNPLHRLVRPLGTFLALVLTAGAPAPVRAADGWTTHRDPRGYVVDVPPGWNLQYDDHALRATLTAPDGTRAVIRALVRPGRLDGGAAAALAHDADAQVTWEAPRAAGSSIVTLTGGGARGGKAFFTWANAPQLGVGWLYAETGTPMGLLRNRLQIGEVFLSYHVVPAPDSARGLPPAAGTGASAQLRYATFRDPQESMFSVELPAQWRPAGGANRRAPVDIRPAFSATSPGKAVIESGDADIPYFELPNAGTQMAGMRAGSPYRTAGATLILEPFVEGATFARQYAQRHFGRVCGNLRIEQSRTRADAVAALNGTYAQYGLPVRVSAGEVAFSCTIGGVPARGYVFAGTQRTVMDGAGIWNVQYLLDYVAVQDLAPQAQAALQHAAATFRIDPAWANANNDTMTHISAITTQTGNQISKIISDTYWQNSATTFHAIEHYDEYAVRGQQDVVDPENPKTTITLDDRYEYNFLRGDGTIWGSDVPAQPGPEFRALIARP
ncbi:MAG TPA: hypothetical protein VMD91_04225 [Candidatus Sulfotelmatobacter sp.]|nr:hypothetical protein [Candidatus Sulfotelmatobacter sp.]